METASAPSDLKCDRNTVGANEYEKLLSKVRTQLQVDTTGIESTGIESIGDDSSTDPGQRNSTRLFGAPINGRYPCLDIARAWCIVFVCIDHKNSSFSSWNFMYTQGWVLQWLFMISGVCYGMSSKSLGGFLIRLGAYFIFGVGCNIVAWAGLGKDWKHEMFGVVFQFWFIAILMVFLMVLAPLRIYLKSVRDRYANNTYRPADSLLGMSLFAVGFITTSLGFQYAISPLLQTAFSPMLVAMVKNTLGEAAKFWGMPTEVGQANEFIHQLCRSVNVSVTNVYLVCIFPMISHHIYHVGWAVLANTYLHKCIQYRAASARMLTGFDYTMLGLTCFFYGLSHRQFLGKYIARYWFLVFSLGALLWPPGRSGRFDENPPTNLKERMQDNALEGGLAIIFLTAIERMCDPKIFSEDKLEFINLFALLAYLVHELLHMALPLPLNYIFLLTLMFPCYVATMKK